MLMQERAWALDFVARSRRNRRIHLARTGDQIPRWFLIAGAQSRSTPGKFSITDLSFRSGGIGLDCSTRAATLPHQGGDGDVVSDGLGAAFQNILNAEILRHLLNPDVAPEFRLRL